MISCFAQKFLRVLHAGINSDAKVSRFTATILALVLTAAAAVVPAQQAIAVAASEPVISPLVKNTEQKHDLTSNVFIENYPRVISSLRRSRRVLVPAVTR